MNQKKTIWIAVLLLFAGLSLIALSNERIQRSLQVVKYGNPISLCLDDFNITLNEDWRIVILKRNENGWPLIGGLFPMFERTDAVTKATAYASLKSLTSNLKVSIHKSVTEISRADMLRNCNKNDACQIMVSEFDGGSQVIKISSPGVMWINYVDAPIMIGIYGDNLDRVDGITIGVCKGQ